MSSIEADLLNDDLPDFSMIAISSSFLLILQNCIMSKRILLFTCLLMLSVISFAQTKMVKGTITDENGAAIASVNVTPRGSRQGTQTDAQGNFTINVPANTSVLNLSSVGFTSQQVNIAGRDNITVTLQRAVAREDEVVVVGYQTVRRKDLTGSVSSVGAKELKDIPLSNAAEALQGRVAGVQATVTEGAPGADVVVRVRGGGSITQDNNPLYIVDGIQVDNALSIIPPQDIASIDVLKDASTTAIYGARGANGVIIITTKSGRTGKTNITYNGSFGARKLTKFMDVLSPYDFVRWQYERSRSSAADSSSFAQTYGTTWDTLENYKNVAPINWQEEVFGRSASFQNHNLSVSGGSDKTSFNLSLTANREDGILIQSGFDRNVVNFKLDHKATDKVKVGFTARYIDQTIDGAGTTNSGTRATNRLRHTINYRPFELASSPAGGIDEFDEAYYLASSGATNPILLTQAEYRDQTYKATLVNGYASFNLLKNLVFKSTLGYESSKTQTNQFFSKITGTARNFASLPVAIIETRDYISMMMSNTLQYTKTKFKEHHDFSVLAGQEMIDRRFVNSRIETRYFPADITPDKALGNMGLGTAPSGSFQPLPVTYESAPDRIFSLFGRVTYGYDDKYLATFNLRADRSSKFNSENGTLVFPSGSVAWRFSKEKFMENVNFITDAKVRYGYGAVGNNRIGDFLYLQLYGVTGQYALNHSIVPGFAPPALANPNLKWEKNLTSNLGLDLSMLKNRVQFSMDIYKNTG
ncbi:MAG: SusC/RagA family TonB-linked outer membrane protein, partial [Pedobacter sp.]